MKPHKTRYDMMFKPPVRLQNQRSSATDMSLHKQLTQRPRQGFRIGLRLSGLLCLLALCLTPTARAYAPTSSYHRYQIQGWTVLFSDELVSQHHFVAGQVAILLQNRLGAVSQLLPGPALRALRKVRIWIEWNDPTNAGGAYHPDPAWLIEHGLNPEMAHSVEFTNATQLLDWSQRSQPMMVLHELAHAYHDQVLGFQHPEIEQLYAQALASGKYEKVTYNSGPPRRAYAMNNPQEYFAESSEAYFGINDFYPFRRTELQAFDPDMAALLARLWHLP